MTWGDVIEKAESERFIGHEQELFTFKLHIERNPPRYLIVYNSDRIAIVARRNPAEEALSLIFQRCYRQS
jgi:hypothetical protein